MLRNNDTRGHGAAMASSSSPGSAGLGTGSASATRTTHVERLRVSRNGRTSRKLPRRPPPLGNREAPDGECERAPAGPIPRDFSPSSRGIAVRPGASPQERERSRRHPSRDSAAPGFEVGQPALVHSEPQGELRLGEPEPSSRRAHAVAETRPRRFGVVPEEANDAPMVTGQRPRASELPEPERCARHAELSGEDSLRQPPIESATANVFTNRLGLVRVTPWNRGLSYGLEPNWAERQRGAGGSSPRPRTSAFLRPSRAPGRPPAPARECASSARAWALRARRRAAPRRGRAPASRRSRRAARP